LQALSAKSDIHYYSEYPFAERACKERHRDIEKVSKAHLQQENLTSSVSLNAANEL
jgi:hypothetical protein